MSLYEYYCTECKERFEAIVNKDHKDGVVCSKCQMLANRLVSKCAHKINGYCYNNDVRRDKECNQ